MKTDNEVKTNYMGENSYDGLFTLTEKTPVESLREQYRNLVELIDSYDNLIDQSKEALKKITVSVPIVTKFGDGRRCQSLGSSHYANRHFIVKNCKLNNDLFNKILDFKTKKTMVENQLEQCKKIICDDHVDLAIELSLLLPKEEKEIKSL